MAEDEKDQDLPTEELEDEEELLEEPAEPEEDEVKCEEGYEPSTNDTIRCVHQMFVISI